jgi:hypothetical protein
MRLSGNDTQPTYKVVLYEPINLDVENTDLAKLQKEVFAALEKCFNIEWTTKYVLKLTTNVDKSERQRIGTVASASLGFTLETYKIGTRSDNTKLYARVGEDGKEGHADEGEIRGGRQKRNWDGSEEYVVVLDATSDNKRMVEAFAGALKQGIKAVEKQMTLDHIFEILKIINKGGKPLINIFDPANVTGPDI